MGIVWSMGIEIWVGGVRQDRVRWVAFLPMFKFIVGYNLRSKNKSVTL